LYWKTFNHFYPPPFSPLVCPPYRTLRKPWISTWNVLYHTSFRNYASISLQVPSNISILFVPYIPCCPGKGFSYSTGLYNLSHLLHSMYSKGVTSCVDWIRPINGSLNITGTSHRRAVLFSLRKKIYVYVCETFQNRKYPIF
jgi:hypothetical protein